MTSCELVTSRIGHRRRLQPSPGQIRKSFNLIDTPLRRRDRIQRNFEPLQRQVESLRQMQLMDNRAKVILLRNVCRWLTGGTKKVAASGSSAVLQPPVSRVLPTDDLEPLQYVRQ
jgi:hypothetical protein